ncbi:hypothetical protein TTHERM_00556650 (macronuclear) [Tetrahymena thermophila SB210]|uniref:Uncharacterized protein n=1 Tax=Tetrahymena thermophila (strain SB210) TaxID=312017 RepID=I7MLH0_TETTS|nr:hypothetical protein TTHERM_00556650 [Tetrahymena thermophila SB210]EAS02083.2 hypothetical protein TTHERM_00556650 [Tetrahymena thermophila SB210]|eukprot:XP_001022328.2 hypothetical protein TTHERM_00556650 [Tetrahymena thermophila SB210]
MYSQENELKNAITFIGLKIFTQCTISNVQIKISFGQFQTKKLIFEEIQPIRYRSNTNEQLQQKIGQIYLELSSFPNLQPYLREMKLFELQNLNLSIENLEIQSKNLQAQVIYLGQNCNINIQNLHLKDSLIEENLVYNNYLQPYIMTYINSDNNFKIDNLIVQNCNFRQQYVLIYSYSNDEKQIQIIIDNFVIKDSYIVNSLIYIDNEYISNQFAKINLKSENIDYEGINSLIFIKNNVLILTLQLEINNKIKTQNGLIQLSNQQQLDLLNSYILINEQSEISLGLGGILQIFDVTNLKITDLNVISQSQRVIQGQFGGIFQMNGIYELNLDSVQARSVKFEGQGGFAYIQANKIYIKNSNFKDFYSKGSGGTMFIIYFQLDMKNVIIANSQSELLGGAIYFQNYEIQTIFNFQNVKILNSEAFIGGGFIINTYAQELIGVSFENNKSVKYDNNIFFPISFINIIGFGEFNPQLGDGFQHIPKEFSQQNFYNQQQINLKDVNINQIYYFELEFVFTDGTILRYEDLQTKNFSYSSKSSKKVKMDKQKFKITRSSTLNTVTIYKSVQIKIKLDAQNVLHNNLKLAMLTQQNLNEDTIYPIIHQILVKITKIIKFKQQDVLSFLRTAMVEQNLMTVNAINLIQVLFVLSVTGKKLGLILCTQEVTLSHARNVKILHKI